MSTTRDSTDSSAEARSNLFEESAELFEDSTDTPNSTDSTDSPDEESFPPVVDLQVTPNSTDSPHSTAEEAHGFPEERREWRPRHGDHESAEQDRHESESLQCRPPSPQGRRSSQEMLVMAQTELKRRVYVAETPHRNIDKSIRRRGPRLPVRSGPAGPLRQEGAKSCLVCRKACTGTHHAVVSCGKFFTAWDDRAWAPPPCKHGRRCANVRKCADCRLRMCWALGMVRIRRD